MYSVWDKTSMMILKSCQGSHVLLLAGGYPLPVFWRGGSATHCAVTVGKIIMMFYFSDLICPKLNIFETIGDVTRHVARRVAQPGPYGKGYPSPKSFTWARNAWPFTPWGRATPETVLWPFLGCPQGRRPVAVFFPFGYPTLYGPACSTSRVIVSSFL